MESRVDIEEVATSTKVGKKIDRHCGFCLTLIPAEEVKLCSKCKRRAYCSKECQKADWKPTLNDPTTNGKICGYGQGHKNWCGLPYGEEDLDWKVTPISGKGLGIVALRDLPPLYRILVEGMQISPEEMEDPSDVHPGLGDLHPPNTSVATKFSENANGLMSSNGLVKVGLRLSRTNHSCTSNSAFTEDPITNVFVLLSERGIKSGEEICRNYMQGFGFPLWTGTPSFVKVGISPKTVADWREELERRWGVLCPALCPCRQESKEKILKESQELWSYINTNPFKKPALSKLQKVIENAKEFCVGPLYLSTFYMNAWRLAMTRSKTMNQARNYLKMSQEISAAALHPETVRKVGEKWNPSNFSRYSEYLAAEFYDE